MLGGDLLVTLKEPLSLRAAAIAVFGVWFVTYALIYRHLENDENRLYIALFGSVSVIGLWGLTSIVILLIATSIQVIT